MTGLQVEFASDKSKPWTKFYPDDFSVEDRDEVKKALFKLLDSQNETN